MTRSELLERLFEEYPDLPETTLRQVLDLFLNRLSKRLNKATVLNCVDLVFLPLSCSKPKGDEIQRQVSRLMFLKNIVFALQQEKR